MQETDLTMTWIPKQEKKNTTEQHIDKFNSSHQNAALYDDDIGN